MGSPEHGPPKPPPEADLIRRARQARGLGIEEAAKLTRVRIGRYRWRQIETSYKGKVGASDRVYAPDKTLAHMAHTVGVTSAQLAEYRPEAADILRDIELQNEGRPASLPDPLGQLTLERQRIILDMIAELPPADRAPALRKLAERVEAGELNNAGGPPSPRPGVRPPQEEPRTG